MKTETKNKKDVFDSLLVKPKEEEKKEKVLDLFSWVEWSLPDSENNLLRAYNTLSSLKATVKTPDYETTTLITINHDIERASTTLDKLYCVNYDNPIMESMWEFRDLIQWGTASKELSAIEIELWRVLATTIMREIDHKLPNIDKNNVGNDMEEYDYDANDTNNDKLNVLSDAEPSEEGE